MIEARGLRRNYGTLEVLRGVDLNVQRGEVVSIVGASGAGKSTLLHILGTLDTPDAGTLVIGGTDVIKLDDHALSIFRNRKVGFVFQSHHLLPEFSALENICMPAFIAGTTRKKAEAKAMELLGLLNLAERASHKPQQLSGGEQQRVAVARALMNSPDVVLADEPSGNLDSEHAAALHALFFSLRDHLGQTFVIVTHNQALADMADRTLTMRDGVFRP